MSGRIRIILLGGTIDSKSYKHTKEFQERGESPEFVDPLSSSTVERYLKCKNYPVECSLVALKDSQKINAVDTDELLTLIADTDEPVKVVVMGTDALARKARETAARLGPNNDKIVLFVGAMEPLSHGKQSDGYDNLDFVMRAAQSGQLRPGVYAAMPDREGKRRIFRADNDLRKEMGLGRITEGRQHKYFTGNTVDVIMPGAVALWR